MLPARHANRLCIEIDLRAGGLPAASPSGRALRDVVGLLEGALASVQQNVQATSAKALIGES